jgi:ABC-type uncharacterized transport system permease subunit
MEDSKPKKTFTGIRRDRKTSRRVVITDFLARFCITFGGIGTIVAVLIVCLFLVWQVRPLFLSASTGDEKSAPAALPDSTLHVGVDQYQRLGYAFHADGSVRVFRVDTGKTIDLIKVVEGRKITAHSFGDRGGTFVLGFDDGTFQFGTIEFATTFFYPAQPIPGVSDSQRDEMKRLVPEKIDSMTEEQVRELPILELAWPGTQADPQGVSSDITNHGVVDVIPTGDLRGHFLRWRLQKPRKIGAPVLLIDHVIQSDGSPTVVTYSNDGKPSLQMHNSRRQVSSTTGLEEFRFGRAVEVALKEPIHQAPAFLRAASTAANIYLAWSDGRTWRYRLSPPDVVEFAQEIDLAENPSNTLTALEFAIGRETLVAGQSDGSIEGWFSVPFDGHTVGWEPIFFKSADQRHLSHSVLWVFKAGSPESRTFHQTGDLPGKVTRENAMKGGVMLAAADNATIDQYLSMIPLDGRKVVRSKKMPAGEAAVTSITPSQRTRLVTAGFADGALGVYNVTAEKRLVYLDTGDKKVQHALITPKDDCVGAIADGTLHRWQIDLKHPEASPKTLFAKVWYEGYDEPKHMWQSSSGSDETEPKFGLMPLIYGTLKGTFYSMLVAVPLALLAAVYTSEFLQPRIKARIKPMIEMMASLPSVVLGFIAANWLAPRVAHHLPGVLALFLCVPMAFLLGAYLWQMLPYAALVRWREARFPLMFLVALPAGVVAALWAVGPAIENSFLGGDVKEFLNGSKEIPAVGNPLAAWMLLLLPVSAVMVMFTSVRFLSPLFRIAAARWTRKKTATLDLFRFALLFVVTLGVALLLSFAFGAVLDDPRGKGSPIDTFSPSNTLVVGFIMGFAVIPIIYTIAEDAMSTVPDHLRAASLGAGATHWQTAVRIVIPTAMSGLFSACMIGLGRAVGETMIVLMAAGGTAIMEPNVFNGFRTLSANIATELLEAPTGSTHARTLYLAALVLFIITFAVNTLAEVVRQRFRKRAFQL